MATENGTYLTLLLNLQELTFFSFVIYCDNPNQQYYIGTNKIYKTGK